MKIMSRKEPPIQEPRLPAKLSARAASVAADMERLEQERDEALAYAEQCQRKAAVQLTEAERRIVRSEDALVAALQRVEQLQQERDHFHTAYVSVMAQMRAGAQVFIQCLDHANRGGPRLDENDRAALAKVEEALMRPPAQARAAEEPEEANANGQGMDRTS